MMGWTEKERCIFCDKGGKLLVCNDDGCPISVHKDCMGCKARFSDLGNFYCPYCIYRRLTMETRQLRDKAMLAKKALSIFLGEKDRAGNDQEPNPEMANEKEPICLESVNNLLDDDVQNQSIQLEKNQPCKGTRESEQTDGLPNRIYNGNTCGIMVVYEAHKEPIVAHGVDLCKEQRMNTDELESGVCEGIRVEDRAGNAECEDGGVQQRATFKEKAPLSNNVVVESSIEMQTTRQKRKRSEVLNRTGNRRTEAHMSDRSNAAIKGSLEAVTGTVSCLEITNSSNAGELKNSSRQLPVDRYAKPPLLKGKRRVRWSVEEEDMLKEGVKKFMSTAHKNLPWKKVLEFGHHVFDASRTPSDLKDKWRNMCK